MNEGTFKRVLNKLVQNHTRWETSDKNAEYRQLEILYWTLQGKSLKQRADKIESNPSTVNFLSQKILGILEGADVDIDKPDVKADLIAFIHHTYGDPPNFDEALLPNPEWDVDEPEAEEAEEPVPPDQDNGEEPPDNGNGENGDEEEPEPRPVLTWIILILAGVIAVLLFIIVAVVLGSVLTGRPLFPTRVAEASTEDISEIQTAAIADHVETITSEAILNPSPTTDATKVAADAIATHDAELTEIAPTELPPPTDTPPPTNTPRPSPTPTPVDIFFDDFNDGIDSTWSYNPEEFAVIQGQLTALSTGVWMYLGSEDWNNYAVEMDVEKGNWDIYTAMAEGNHLRIRADSFGLHWMDIPNLSIGKIYPYKLKIENKDGVITTYVNGQDVGLGFVRPELDHGSIALVAHGQSGAAIDNFRVIPLDQ